MSASSSQALRGMTAAIGGRVYRRCHSSLNSCQLLQAAHHRRYRRIRKTGLPVGNADFADIDVAFGIERDAVRREELAGLEAGAVFAAEPCDAFAFGVDDGKT